MSRLNFLPAGISDILEDDLRPVTRQDFESELEQAKIHGYNVPDIDYERMIVSQEQAVAHLRRLGVLEGSLFFEIMSRYRAIPLGQGEELNTLEQIVENVNDYCVWDDDYPKFSEKYLELSSIEGEGSYFYDKATDAVYDVNWGDMPEFVGGRIPPTWISFKEFLEWYYS